MQESGEDAFRRRDLPIVDHSCKRFGGGGGVSLEIPRRCPLGGRVGSVFISQQELSIHFS